MTEKTHSASIERTRSGPYVVGDLSARVDRLKELTIVRCMDGIEAWTTQRLPVPLAMHWDSYFINCSDNGPNPVLSYRYKNVTCVPQPDEVHVYEPGEVGS